jgi:hypothetical protein
VILEEIKMVDDTPDDLVNEIFTETYAQAIRWAGRFSARSTRVEGLTRSAVRSDFGEAYIACMKLPLPQAGQV